VKNNKKAKKMYVFFTSCTKLGGLYMSNKKDKKFSLSIEPEAKFGQTYNLFLVSTTEDSMQIDFASKNETPKEIHVNIRNSVSIPADQMKEFLYDILQAMIEYENEYHNGKGFSVPSE